VRCPCFTFSTHTRPLVCLYHRLIKVHPSSSFAFVHLSLVACRLSTRSIMSSVMFPHVRTSASSAVIVVVQRSLHFTVSACPCTSSITYFCMYSGDVFIPLVSAVVFYAVFKKRDPRVCIPRDPARVSCALPLLSYVNILP